MDETVAILQKLVQDPQIQEESRNVYRSGPDAVNQIKIGSDVAQKPGDSVGYSPEIVNRLHLHGVMKSFFQLPVIQLFQPGRHMIQVNVFGGLIELKFLARYSIFRSSAHQVWRCSFSQRLHQAPVA